MLLPAAIHADPLGLAVALGAGMLSFLSPCVLPLVPGYVSMVSGLSAAELDALRARPARLAPVEVSKTAAPEVVPKAAPAPDVAHERVLVGATARAPIGASGGHVGPAEPMLAGAPASGAAEAPAGPAALAVPPTTAAAHRRRLLVGMLAFVGGFTVVFVALGASASTLGRLLLTHQRPLEVASGIVIVCFGTLLVALAAGLRLPAVVIGERRIPVRPSLLGSFAPPIMGMAFAFAWTPCIGPVLGSVLALAAGTGGSPVGGVALLTAYSLGLGVPFILCGLAFGRMTDALARMRHRLRGVELLGGAVLVAFGLLLVTGHVDVVSSTISGWLRDLHLGRLSTS